MFRKNKTTAKAASGNDLNTLLDVFDKIISGEISHTGESPADITLFENPEVANKFNEVVETYKRFNNNFVMRLNEAMESIGDNSYVKNMIVVLFRFCCLIWQLEILTPKLFIVMYCQMKFLKHTGHKKAIDLQLLKR